MLIIVDALSSGGDLTILVSLRPWTRGAADVCEELVVEFHASSPPILLYNRKISLCQG
nr:MAG TPA: hypothetical protein [Caudoviricetes sp.]